MLSQAKRPNKAVAKHDPIGVTPLTNHLQKPLSFNEKWHPIHLQLTFRKVGDDYVTNPKPILRKYQASIFNKIEQYHRNLKPEKQIFRRSYNVKGKDWRQFLKVSEMAIMRKSFNSLLIIDIKKAFESIPLTRILGFLKNIDLPEPEFLASLVSFKGTLARGAKPSNLILEMLLRATDHRINAICIQLFVQYFRYADDLFFFSKTEFSNEFLPYIENIIKQEGFRLNKDKTKLLNSKESKTWISDAKEKIKPKKEYLRKFAKKNS